MRYGIIIATCLLATAAQAQYGTRQSNPYGQSQNYGTGSNSNSHYVAPHTRSDGSYTSGYYRTNPDSSRSNNYGARGNYNPHSGKFED